MNRSEEIKIRVTPLEKSAWQRDAEVRQMSLSELMRVRMNVLEPVGPTELYPTETKAYEWRPPTAIEGTLESHAIKGDKVINMLTGEEIPVTTLRDWSGFTPQTDVPTSGEVVSKGIESYWEEDELKPRRSEPCVCGKPPFLFCRACDA